DIEFLGVEAIAQIQRGNHVFAEGIRGFPAIAVYIDGLALAIVILGRPAGAAIDREALAHRREPPAALIDQRAPPFQPSPLRTRRVRFTLLQSHGGPSPRRWYACGRS